MLLNLCPVFVIQVDETELVPESERVSTCIHHIIRDCISNFIMKRPPVPESRKVFYWDAGETASH